MKIILLLFLLLLSVVVKAQPWQIFKPDYTYNYIVEGAELIFHRIQTDSIKFEIPIRYVTETKSLPLAIPVFQTPIIIVKDSFSMRPSFYNMRHLLPTRGTSLQAQISTILSP